LMFRPLGFSRVCYCCGLQRREVSIVFRNAQSMQCILAKTGSLSAESYCVYDVHVHT